MRGDRPRKVYKFSTPTVATPHARGSTHPMLDLLNKANGYPACAGIDPRFLPHLPPNQWLPRMRGDRPPSESQPREHHLATPHARGSTCAWRGSPSPPGGYPACAGIDLCTLVYPHSMQWLPRMRGDRPRDYFDVGTPELATPHARGSTFPRRAFLPSEPGYPACAGIDRKSTPLMYRTPRLPRMRGDRPVRLARSRVLIPATPHARGSTFCRSQDPELVRGYPACAGIDPVSPSASPFRTWLPRMRGDRPPLARETVYRDAATPHARGSTRAKGRSAWPNTGYPACAGIDPT